MKAAVLIFAAGVGVAGALFAQETKDEGTKKTILDQPVKVTVGYESGGIGATAKGDHTEAIGDGKGAFAPGYAYGVDATWNSKTSNTDQAEYDAAAGLVETNKGFPRWCGLVKIVGKNGQFKTGDTPQKVNQILGGIDIEYVPTVFSDWVWNRVSMSVKEYREDPCLVMGDDYKAKHPECKYKKGPALEAPPKFTFGFFHPLRTRSEGDAPDGIEADKVTATFTADNTVFRKVPLRVVASLSETYPTTGANKKFKGKIDIGIGFPSLSDKFTPIVKYVSGEKDGFKYDKALIVGALFDFGKRFLQ